MTRELMSSASIPVLELGEVREVEVPAGLTISEMIERAFPAATKEELAGLRVLMVTSADVAVVHPRFWPTVRPKPEVQVILRIVPAGDNAMRTVLTVVISVAAMALGQFWAAAIVPTAGLGQTLVGGLITAGLTVAGTMLLNALIPIQPPEGPSKPGQTYTIQGWQNTARPNEPIPFALGKMRTAPPFAAPPYTTIVGDDQFVTALFTFGYGPLTVSDIRIGDTSIDEYDNVELQLFEGRTDDDSVTLYPRQVLEQREGVELTRPKIEGVWTDKPIVRQGAGNATEVAFIFGFPAGLFQVNDDGDTKTTEVQVRIRQRLVGTETWTDMISLSFKAKKRKPFFRQYRTQLPARGKYEFEVMRLTTQGEDARQSRTVILAAIQSFRPEHPLNFDKPLALLGVRIKASEQLSGALDSVNAVVERQALDWDGTTWTEQESRNPATAYRAALQGDQNPWPVLEAEIDLEQLQDWHAWCAVKGLKYDHIHEQPQSFGEMLLTICAAGRATPRHDGVKWGVVIDRPGDPVVDHISPRNAREFRWRRNYLKPPHAFRVEFRDETNDWELAERIIPWPDHVGDITLTEDLPMIGKTDPDEVWIEARRRQYELIHRPDSFSALQDGGARVATRGDTVMAAFDVLDRTLTAARIRAADGQMITLDEPVTMEAGTDYALRYRTYSDAEDAIGSSVVVPLVTRAGTSSIVLAKSTIDAPRIGEIAHFGLLGEESRALRIRGIEAGDEFAQVVHMIAAAPEIDTLTDAEVPPPWTGYVGEEIDLSEIAPQVPRFVTAELIVNTSEFSGTEFVVGYQLLIELAPGLASTAPVSEYELEYREAGDVAWTIEIISAAEAGIELGPFDGGETIEYRARAKAADGTPSAYTATGSQLIQADTAVPQPSDEITVEGGLGHATLTIPVTDPAWSKILLFRVPDGETLGSEHIVGDYVSVTPGTFATVVDGDSTRVDLALNGDFATTDDWTEGTGWSIGTGDATHTAGSTGRLAQATGALAGQQRIALTVSGRTAGTITPILTGSDEVAGAAIPANGTFSQTLDADSAATAPTGFAFEASADFDGTVTAVVRFIETAVCIPAGLYTYYVAPHNVANVPGLLDGPVSAHVL